MNRVLVTGGQGLIGSAFSDDFTKVGSQNYQRKKYRFDLRNQSSTYSMFDVHRPDYVIHTAAKVGGLGSNINNQAEYFYDNLMINTNVIECCRLFKVKKLIAFSSTCIFPDGLETLTEDAIHDGQPHMSNYGYSHAKRMIDVQIKTYNKQYGLNYVSVIPCNVYGPNDNFSLEHGHVIPSLIHKTYLAKNDNTNLEIWGTGKPLREFIYSKDVAKIVEELLYKETPDSIILSPNKSVTISDVVDIIVDEMKFKGDVIYNTDLPDGQFKKLTSNERLKQCSDVKLTSLRNGIRQTIKWFNKNYDFARK